MDNNTKVLREGEVPTPQNPEYISPTSKEIALIAGFPNEDNSALTTGLCFELKSCGFNAAAAVVDKDKAILYSLENCYNSGISLLLGNERLNSLSLLDITQIVNSYKNKQGLAGWWPQTTEVTYNEMSGKLYENYNFLRKQTPSHPVLLALTGYTSGTIQGKPYKQYVENFQNLFSPSPWTYVLFPFGVKGGENYFAHDSFYDNLEIYSLMARYTSVPFWVYCASQSYLVKSTDTGMQPPTESHIRFVVFSALAYGAQGIFYWTYRQWKDTDDVTYANAPVPSTGYNSVTWLYVKNVNEEVRAFNDIFYGCTLVDCRHTGEKLSKYMKHFKYPMGPLENVSDDPEKGFQISHISKEGKNYLVIVNHDPDAPQSINLKFNEYFRVSEIQKSDLSLKTAVVASTVSRTVAAGSYIVFTWE